MKKQLGRRYPEITWTREDEEYRKERMRVYYDIVQYHYPQIAKRIIGLNDHKGLLTVTINNRTGYIPLTDKESYNETLKYIWEHSFNESFIEIVYDEGTNN